MFIQKKVASLDDVSAFPDLIASSAQTKKQSLDLKVKLESEVTKPQLDFKAKLETAQVAQVAEAKKPEHVAIKQKRWATPDEIMSRLNDNYLKWKEEYIEEYGEEYYERYYRFQDWDYEYFDKLDEKLERELELEEEEERKRKENAEYVTEDYEEYEKE
jgi:hypothetical protein